MSISKAYRDQFLITIYDEDVIRSEKVQKTLSDQGFQVHTYHSRGLLMESWQRQLPHLFITYYQPLSLKFRELLDKLREHSAEVHVVVMGGAEFWPGVSKLLQDGRANDFWVWPPADMDVLALRVDQAIAPILYRYLAESKNPLAETLMNKINVIEATQSLQMRTQSLQWSANPELSEHASSEPELIRDLMDRLKSQFDRSEFLYLKNYPARSQLLVTHSSFAQAPYFRGQNFSFHGDSTKDSLDQRFGALRITLAEAFHSDEFVFQPVELGTEFYGILVAFHFDDVSFLQKTTRLLAMHLRHMKSELRHAQPVEQWNELVVTASELPLLLSKEVLRAREIAQPVSMIHLHCESIEFDAREQEALIDLVSTQLRPYDYLAVESRDALLIVLPHCSYENAAVKAETLRRLIVARGLKTQNTPLRLCLGVSEFPSLSEDSDQLREDAKKACTQVLVSGKNKVCLHTPEAAL